MAARDTDQAVEADCLPSKVSKSAAKGGPMAKISFVSQQRCDSSLKKKKSKDPTAI